MAPRLRVFSAPVGISRTLSVVSAIGKKWGTFTGAVKVVRGRRMEWRCRVETGEKFGTRTHEASNEIQGSGFHQRIRDSSGALARA